MMAMQMSESLIFVYAYQIQWTHFQVNLVLPFPWLFSFVCLTGFVCKTKMSDRLKPGVLIRIDSFNVESLGDNKFVSLLFLSQTYMCLEYLIEFSAQLTM